MLPKELFHADCRAARVVLRRSGEGSDRVGTGSYALEFFCFSSVYSRTRCLQHTCASRATICLSKKGDAGSYAFEKASHNAVNLKLFLWNASPCVPFTGCSGCLL